MSHNQPPQENPAEHIETIDALRQAPLAYGLEFKWGGFGVTKAADDFYGLQVASLDAKITPEQFADLPTFKDKVVRPRLILAAPHELPHEPACDPSREESVGVVSYAKEQQLTIWAAHATSPKVYYRDFWQTAITDAREQLADDNDIAYMTDDELAQHLTFSGFNPDSEEAVKLSEVSIDQIAQLQLSHVLAHASEVITTDVTVVTMDIVNEAASKMFRQSSIKAFAATALFGLMEGMLVPGEGMAATTAKILAPLGLVAVQGRRLLQSHHTQVQQLTPAVLTSSEQWVAISGRIARDVQAAYSPEGFVAQMRKMLGQDGPHVHPSE